MAAAFFEFYFEIFEIKKFGFLYYLIIQVLPRQINVVFVGLQFPVFLIDNKVKIHLKVNSISTNTRNHHTGTDDNIQFAIIGDGTELVVATKQRKGRCC